LIFLKDNFYLEFLRYEHAPFLKLFIDDVKNMPSFAAIPLLIVYLLNALSLVIFLLIPVIVWVNLFLQKKLHFNRIFLFFIYSSAVAYMLLPGYVIKPIAKAVRHEGNLLELRVAPTLLPKSDNLSSVNSERNAVSLYFKGRDEPLTLEGLGAGRMPTARSVVADIVRVVTSPHESRYWIYNLFTCSPQDYSGLMQMLVSPYYLRLDVDDKPGVLGNVGTIIGANGVNIEEVRQMQNEKKDGSIPMVLLVGPANELTIIKMIDELQNQSYVKEILKIRRKPK